jgi:thioester reductase-like protein
MIQSFAEANGTKTENVPLAIVGIGCRLPGSVDDVSSFWKLLAEGRSGIQEVPSDRWDVGRHYEPDPSVPGMVISKWGGFVRDVDRFDARFWGLSPREVMRMDPQQRWLLEVAWEALEDSGAVPSRLRGTSVGVFVGIASNDYAWLQMPFHEEINAYTNSGNTASIASNRISYLLDLRGPSTSVDTACSSALVAVWMACRGIWSGSCSAALAGGVNALITPHASIGFSRASMLSPSGQCFAFDARANGYVRAEGAGMVYIKRLDQAIADRDRIYSVIRAAVVNQDGHTSSMTVPGVEGQSAMLRTAYREAGLSPASVMYMEAHGTGTPVGDPIECTAIGQVLREGRSLDNRCLIGSVKSNIGHLEAGSGLPGLIKAALVLHKDMVPPCCNFETPNPHIPFDALQLEVASRLQPLPHRDGERPIAGVNSFGFGGTNAHVVLEAAPPPPPAAVPQGPRTQRPYALPISARDEIALRSYVESYQQFLSESPDNLADICYSAGARKELHDHRLLALGNDAEQLRSALDGWLRNAADEKRVITTRAARTQAPLVFVFTGQGPQWWAMGRQLLEREPIFRQTVESIDEHFKKLAGFSLLEEMTRDEKDSRIDRTDVAQPAIFAVQVGLAELWKSWGVRPAQVIGHSVGEVAAAYCAGIYSLKDAVQIIYHRSRLQNMTGGHGRMLAAGITASEARERIGHYADCVQVAVLNSHSLVTLAGDTQPLEEIAAGLEAAGKFNRWLRINYAFHTHQMEPIRDELLEVLADIRPQPARVPFISTVTGGLLDGEQLDNVYWWRNVRQPVLFGPAIAQLLQAGEQTFLEIGPHPSLASSLEEYVSAQGYSGCVFHSLQRKSDETFELLANLAGLSARGTEIDWAAVNQSGGDFVPQPRYPWNRESFWLESKRAARQRLAPAEHPLLGLRTGAAQPTWQFILHPGRYAYLNDHRFWDSVVFPGAGYGEIGLALARLLFPEELHAVEDLEIKKALFIDADQPPTVQVVFDPTEKTFFVHSSIAESDDWELHAQGRLARIVPAQPDQVDLAALQSTLPDHFDHERYYAEFAAAGYQFGPNFQHVQNVWRRKGEALAEIVVPEAVAATVGQYHFHPAVLDACFHIFKGVQVVPADAVPEDYFYLPQGIRRIRLDCDKPPARLWAHAHLKVDDGNSLVADIFVYDGAGRRIAEVLDFRADRVEQKRSSDDIDNCYYQFAWEACELRGRGVEKPLPFATTAEIIGSARGHVPEIYRQHALDVYQHEFVPRIEAIAAQFIQNAWLDLGWNLPVGERFTSASHLERLRVIETHHRLALSQLRSLEDRGLLRRVGDEQWEVTQLPRRADVIHQLEALAREYPRFETEVELHQRTGAHLATILTGETDPLQLLFPGGSLELLERFYVEGADLPVYNRLMQLAASRAIAALPTRRALRVLEVGAGTGSLTKAILPSLPREQTEYLFTDVGPAFLAAAKTQFAEYSGVDYKLLDLEKDPVAQGFTPGSFDLILATDALHATCDLRQTLTNLRTCLAPGGLLMFLEVLTHRHAWNSIFGLLKGWWRYTDTTLRTNSPLLDRNTWHSLLADCGYENVSSFGGYINDDESEQAVFLAFAPAAPAQATIAPATVATATVAAGTDASSAASQGSEQTSIATATKGYVVFADQGGVADQLIARLQERGIPVVRVRPGTAFQQAADGEFVVAVDSTDEMRRLLGEARSMIGELAGLVHCWSLDHPTASTLDADRLSEAQRTGVLNALHLVQAEEALPSHVWFVTRNVHHAQPGDLAEGLASAPLVGLLRVANNELAQTRLMMVDLDASSTAELADDLFHEVVSGDGEVETTFRGGRRRALRLKRVRTEDLPVRKRNAVGPQGSLIPFRLETDKPGILANLQWHETRRRAPEPGEIEIRVRAGGINFRDVMKALGTYPGNPVDVLWFGDDVAGVVERVGANVHHLKPGDEVAGMAPYGFRAFATVDARMVFKKPPQLTFEQAATVPTVFLTAHYALHHLARMEPGEKVLIHAGAGGVGQAAIQIARRLGLEIFATAGSEDKRRLLRDLGAHHVMSSRTLEFADQIQKITGGRGVDAVLNSLAGDFIPKSMSVLAPFGRFLEIGKIDIYKNSKLGLEALRNNISYFVIDLAQHLTHKPDFVAKLFAELGELFAKGEYQPLPYSVFPITKVADAFRFMAQGKHIGKNVLSFDVDEIPIGPCTEDQHRYKPDATYLITGGAGGFGLEIAKWMAARGARHLVLSSRSGPREDAAKDIEQLRAAGVNVVDARCDVTRWDEVAELIQRIRAEMPPLKGILHGAMVLDDEFLSVLDESRFRKALDPKMLGAWNLFAATRDLELDEFIGFSSFSSVIGGPKQSNYNAGNFFLEALAQHSHAQGQPAITIAWGALLGAGFVERNQKTAQYLDKVGMKAFNLDEALRVFGRLTHYDPVQVIASRADWRAISKASVAVARSNTFAALAQENRESEGGGSIVGRLQATSPESRQRLIEDFLAAQVAGVFGAVESAISRDTPLTSLGLDSLMAIELTNRIERELGMGIPMGALLNGPSITMLAETVMRLLAPTLATGADSSESESTNVGATPLEKVDIPQAEFPLSASQQTIWQQSRTNPGSSLGHRVCSVRLAATVNTDRLRHAFEALFKRHPMLTVVMRETQGQVVQSFRKDVVPESQEVVLIGAAQSQVDAALAAEVNRPFDLQQGPLTRLSVFRLSDQSLQVVLTSHAIVADSWSMSLLMQDLLEGYASQASGASCNSPSADYSYEDFVAWEEKQESAASITRCLDFWKRELQDAPAQLALPTDHARLKVPSLSGGEFGFQLDDELAVQLLAAAAQLDTSLYATLLAAFEILLHQECRQTDLLVGTSVAGRPHAELREMVGSFSHLVPIRSQLPDSPTCADVIRQATQRVSATRDYPPPPLSRLFAELKKRPDASRPPLVQAVFLMERPLGIDPTGLAVCQLGQSGHRFHWGDLAIESAACPTAPTRHEINLAVEEASGRIIGVWRFPQDLFTAETIKRLHDNWVAVLEQIARDPLQSISSVKLAESPLAMQRPERCDTIAWRESGAAGSAAEIDYFREAQLPADITTSQVSPFSPAKRDRVLLTGATGFLGAFLLDELLRRTDAKIYCLVRAKSEAQALERLQTNLERYELSPDGCAQRVIPVLGDLSDVRLGLSEETFQQLGREIDVIYHNGAVVNLVYPYPLLRDANVRGTQEVLRLAALHHVKPTHYVSTFWVQSADDGTGREVVTEEDSLPPCEALPIGYSRSKWVCETMIAEARERGLPITIYRPGYVTGDSRTGACKADDFIHTVVLACTRVGSLPALDMNLEVTPVDFVSQAIVQLSLQPEHLGNTYHLVNPQPLPMTVFAEWMQGHGLDVRLLPYNEWREELARLSQGTPDELLGPLMSLLGAGEGDEPGWHPHYDCRLATTHLAPHGIVCPAANDELLSIYHTFLQRTGMMWTYEQLSGATAAVDAATATTADSPANSDDK